MFSKLNVSKYRGMLAAILLFIVFNLISLFINIYGSFNLEQDTTRISIANKQRDLAQLIGKSLLRLQQEKRDLLPLDSGTAELKQSIVKFENGLKFFKSDSPDSALFSFLGLNTNATQDGLATIEPIWKSQKNALSTFENGLSIPMDDAVMMSATAEAKTYNQRLLDASSKMVSELEQAAQLKQQILHFVQIAAIIFAVLSFFVILLQLLRHLAASDEKFEAAQKETSDILNTVDEGLLLIDAKGQTGRQMSKAAHAMFGSKITPGEDFRQLVSQLVDKERAEEMKIYIDLLFDPKVKPSLLVQLDPMKEVEVAAGKSGNHRFLSFKLRQLRQKNIITGLLVTVRDITERVLLSRELATAQSEAHLDLEDLLRVFEQEPTTMREFLTVSRHKLGRLNENMRTVGKNSAAYKSLIKNTSITIHGIKGESAALRLLGVSRQAHIMENSMADLHQRKELNGEDLIPVAYELSRVQEQVARIERLFKRITGATGAATNNAVPQRSIFEPTQLIPVPDSDFVAPNNFPAINTLVEKAHGVEVPLPTLPSFSLAPTIRTARPSANVVLNQPLSDLSPLTMLFTPSIPPLEEMAANLKKLSATVAQAVGKNVAMTCDIADIMPSGLMLRVLREVLPQLVRNSVVHGVEMPNDRLKAGKPEQGQLKLVIRKISDDVTEASIKDDGRGITIEAVKARLVEMNVNVDGLSSGQILQHIFDVQFSTSSQVTEHAGRGVGLAFVKESLEKAGAKLKVNTRPGKSTEFLMHFGSQE